MYFSGNAIEKSKLDGSERQTIHQEKGSSILFLSIGIWSYQEKKKSNILCLSISIWSYSKNIIGV